MIMLLAEAIGSGELLLEPMAGAQFGAVLFWVIIFAIVTKAIWNEIIGRTALVTGRNFLDLCSAGGPIVRWVPWLWFIVNLGKDLFLRGGIVALAGLVCYDTLGDLPSWLLAPEWALPDKPLTFSNSPAELRQVIS
jgi:Mn2+/Fe2+ NRAMP family transporter